MTRHCRQNRPNEWHFLSQSFYQILQVCLTVWKWIILDQNRRNRQRKCICSLLLDQISKDHQSQTQTFSQYFFACPRWYNTRISAQIRALSGRKNVYVRYTNSLYWKSRLVRTVLRFFVLFRLVFGGLWRNQGKYLKCGKRLSIRGHFVWGLDNGRNHRSL